MLVSDAEGSRLFDIIIIVVTAVIIVVTAVIIVVTGY